MEVKHNTRSNNNNKKEYSQLILMIFFNLKINQQSLMVEWTWREQKGWKKCSYYFNGNKR